MISSYKPKGHIENKHLLTLDDYSDEEIYEIIDAAITLKQKQRAGKKNEALKGKTVAVIMASPDLQTRLSFEQAVTGLGGRVITMSGEDLRACGKSLSDAAKLMGLYGADCVVTYGFAQEETEALAEYGNFHVINGKSDLHHPCRTLADLMTVYEHFIRLKDLNMAYIGLVGGTVNSMLRSCARLGMNVTVCSPSAPPDGFATMENPQDAACGQDIIYTDGHLTSSGISAEQQKALADLRITDALMAKANKNAVFMHGLPAYRGEEVDACVIDGAQSIVFQQAENRLHVQKAILSLLMKK